MKRNKYAIVAIDMHRGHLDPQVATLPLLPAENCEIVIRNAKKFFDEARRRNIPIVHVVTVYRDCGEILSNPHWKQKNDEPNSTRRGIATHNIAGSPGTQIITELYKNGDYIVNTKKRYSGFFGTDLDFLLRQMDVETVILAGINTSSCVLCTAFEAFNRDYKVYVVEDCCDSMDGQEFHHAAVMFIDRIIGEVIRSKDLLEIL